MKISTVAIGILALGGVAVAAENRSGAGKVPAAAAFERLKALVGEWEEDGGSSKSRLHYELVGGGTAVVEREAAENRPTMLTVYHLDGDRLLLTHYCMAGNQPRMEARAFDPSTGELKFEFLDATNLTSPAAGHMHQVALQLVDQDHLTAQWQFYENGRPKFTETARYNRIR
jgi:hypothetical protein